MCSPYFRSLLKQPVLKCLPATDSRNLLALPAALATLFAVTGLLPVASAMAQTQMKIPLGNLPKAGATADPYAAEALVLELSASTLRYHADGTGERILHVRLRLQSEGAVKQFSVLSFFYASASETPKIRFVRAIKPSGTTIETPTADALEMTAEVSREAPLYSDVKQLQLPVRSLAVGDTLEYELQTTITKPETPGQFWGATHFTAPGSIIVLAESYTLEVPKDKYVQVWSPNHKATRTEHDGLVTYTWTVPQLVPSPRPAADGSTPKPPKDPDQDADGRIVPSLAFTTFHSWADVGDWYRSLAAARAEPTAAVRAKADELTATAKTPEQQARALYGYVSGIRYVGLDLGVGRYQPHAAAEVLSTQYGDCKDKDTLLEAMLRAKGLHPAPALIGFGITPVPDVPSPAFFNHVITTLQLPVGRVWMDSTAETAPFRLLNPSLRDEEALVVPSAAPATLEKTPVALPFPFVSHFDAVATLDGDGLLKGHITMSTHSDDEVTLRAAVRQLAPAQWDAGIQYLSASMGFSGKVSNADLHQQADGADEPVRIAYDYTRESYADWSNLRILPLLPTLGLPAPPDPKTDPNSKTDRDPTDPDPTDLQLGPPQTQIATSRITLPAGYHADLPDPIHASTPWVTLDKTYRVVDGVLLVDRKLVVLQTKVPKAELKSYKGFFRQIHDGEEYFIQLTAARGTRSAVPAGKPADAGIAESSESATELINRAASLERTGDLIGASELLDRVKAMSETTTYLWASYGYIQMKQKHWDEAIADYKRELARHPDEGHTMVLLASTLKSSGKEADGRKLLADYFAEHTSDREIAFALANSQIAARDYPAAVSTLMIATEAQPKDLTLKVFMANVLLRDDRKPEAAKAAKAALEAAEPEDYETMNNASYALAESGIDLPEAEQYSRKAIAVLEAQTAAITPAEVNSHAYGESQTLIASWDTLGWILFRNGKYAEAEPLIRASWRNSLHPEVGEHLARVYEQEGKMAQALETFELASSSTEGSKSPAVTSEINAGLARLHSAGDKRAYDTRLQDTRMYPLKRVPGVSGSASFRLMLRDGGVEDLQLVSGDQKLAPLAPSIKAVSFTDLVPAASKAHLLRNGIVSCKAEESCTLVLVPNGTLQNEQF